MTTNNEELLYLLLEYRTFLDAWIDELYKEITGRYSGKGCTAEGTEG